MSKSMTVETKGASLPLARCEGCSQIVDAEPWPKGWWQTGKSRWGKKYQTSEIAWWCPKCSKK